MGWIVMAVSGFTCGFVAGSAWASMVAHGRLCELRERLGAHATDPPSDMHVQEVGGMAASPASAAHAQ